MASHEADADGIEVDIIFPNDERKKLELINITDVNGDDITVKEVKKQLLLSKDIKAYQEYAMFGGDGRKLELLNDNDLITNYFKYLSPSTGYLTLKLIK